MVGVITGRRLVGTDGAAQQMQPFSTNHAYEIICSAPHIDWSTASDAIDPLKLA